MKLARVAGFILVLCLIPLASPSRAQEYKRLNGYAKYLTGPDGKYLTDSLGQKLHTAVPYAGYVPDETTAIRVAEAVLLAIYETYEIRNEEPLSAKLHGNVWHVWSHYWKDMEGNVKEVWIDKSNGRILRVAEGKNIPMPAAGFVPDEKAAVSIAEAIFTPIYGLLDMAYENSRDAQLNGNVWRAVAYHETERPTNGGAAEVWIDKRDGRILRVTHGQ